MKKIKVYTLVVDWAVEEVGQDVLGVYGTEAEAKEDMQADIASSFANDHPERIEYNKDKTTASYMDGKYNAFWKIQEWEIEINEE